MSFVFDETLFVMHAHSHLTSSACQLFKMNAHWRMLPFVCMAAQTTFNGEFVDQGPQDPQQYTVTYVSARAVLTAEELAEQPDQGVPVPGSFPGKP